MAKAKAKTQKKAAKAKPSAIKKGPAKKAPAAGTKKAPAGKKKLAISSKAATKKTESKAAPQKVVKGAATKPSPTKHSNVPSLKAKPIVKGKAPVPAKPMPKTPTTPAKASPKTPPGKAAVTVAPTKPALPAPVGPKIVAPKVILPKIAEKKVPVAPAKEAKAKPPIIAVMTGVEPIGGPTRTLKRAMKERYVVEFYMNATPGSLYDMISTPSGLSEWFCDDVDVRGEHFTFRWGNDDQTAQCLSRKFGELMRFQWDTDEDPGAYFELRIRIDPMTNETCLVVTDHAWAKDVEEAKALWGSQIHTLQRVLGA